VDLLRDQAGIIARRQALLGGLTSNDVRRLLRRREWVVVHPGVYVDHTGPLTWLQRAWAGVLYAWPAALCGESALRAVEGPGRRKEAGPIQVAVAIGRQVADRPELTVRRMARLEDRACGTWVLRACASRMRCSMSRWPRPRTSQLWAW